LQGVPPRIATLTGLSGDGAHTDDDGLSEEELGRHEVEPLPDREALSILRSPDVTIPLDPDVAADVLLDQDDADEAG